MGLQDVGAQLSAALLEGVGCKRELAAGGGASPSGLCPRFPPSLCPVSRFCPPSVSLILAPQSELGNPLYHVLALTSTTDPVATFAPCLSSLGVFYMVTHLNDVTHFLLGFREKSECRGHIPSYVPGQPQPTLPVLSP